MNVILRRRKLGRTSAREIARLVGDQIRAVRADQEPGLTGDGGWLFRWGYTGTLAGEWRVVNTAEAIHGVSDKRQTRLSLQAAGVSIPETWAAEAWRADAVRGLLRDGDQFVLRPPTHAQGRHLVHGGSTVVQSVLDTNPVYRGGYVSRLINKVAEYRVMVVQGRAVWVAKKTPGNPNDVAWNVARGGRFDNVPWAEWPLRVVKEAIKAHDAMGTDFSGFDVMVDAEGTPYVLELNSAPSQTSPYRQACVAKAFKWVIDKNTKATIPLTQERGGYRKFIHPGVCEEAIV